MPSARYRSLSDLPADARRVIDEARRAVLGTVDLSGRAHVVPITFAIAGDAIVSAIDQKPKAAGRPARLRNIEHASDATVLFDRYDDDWTRLAWVMVRGTARIEPPDTHLDALVARYRPYRDDRPRGEVIVVHPTEIVYWSYR
jgi:PPOX class probable F420-dependent enzyme